MWFVVLVFVYAVAFVISLALRFSPENAALLAGAAVAFVLFLAELS